MEAGGGLTYRQGVNWRSQIDWAFCSLDFLYCINNFHIGYSYNLPSNHAPIVLEIATDFCATSILVERSKYLLQQTTDEKNLIRIPVKFDRIDQCMLTPSLPDPWSFVDNGNEIFDVSNVCCKIDEVLYTVSKNACRRSANVAGAVRENRWKWLLEKKDMKSIWMAVNWKGTFDRKPSTGPSDVEFANYYSNLYRANGSDSNNNCENNNPNLVYIPHLDDPISEREVREGINQIKTNKAPGPDGIPPGVFKLLNDTWILFIVFVLNSIFFIVYPLSWSLAKLFSIFKGGDPNDPGNYRGINIMAALPKLYDHILNNRLQQWFCSDDEQAGAKKGRGCEEQIFTLRLLIDIARKSKTPLYVVFVDFAKAYDKINRNTLIRLLQSMGCGFNMVNAIKNSLENTSSIIGNMTVGSEAGVRQGSPSSCFLFTAYANPMIRMVKEFGEDGWLGNLHLLLLMDDTVLFSTTREGIIWKFKKVLEYCKLYDMKVNQKKTKLLHINIDNPHPLVFDEITVECCDKYVYLGNIIMNAPIYKQVEQHIKNHRKSYYKFQSFLSKNNDAPFCVKHKVWSAALNSAIFYGSETWMSSNLKAVDNVYLSSLRDLLGVRRTVCSDLVFLESGEPTAQAFIKRKQLAFLKRLQSRPNYGDSYFSTFIDKAIELRSPMGLYINQLRQIQGDPVILQLQGLKTKVDENSESTRRSTYKLLNPSLESPSLYRDSSLHIPEYHRTAYTRLRLSSHHLKIETGRWSRIPRERRLCHCGSVQDEVHVLLYCPLLLEIRQEFPGINFHSIETVMTHDNKYELCKYIFGVNKSILQYNAD